MCIHRRRLTHCDPINLECAVVTVTQSGKENANDVVTKRRAKQEHKYRALLKDRKSRLGVL